MTTSAKPIAPLSALARDVHGILTTPELHEAGYTNDMILSLVRRGFLVRLRRGVFAVGHDALGEDARRLAALRSAGDEACLIAVSAARCWSLTRRYDHVVDVAVPRPRRRIRGARVVVHRAIGSEERTSLGPLRIATPSWAIATLAAHIGTGELARVLREASYRGCLHMQELVEIADRDDRRAGIVTLRRAIDLRAAGSSGYASRLEQDVNRYVRGLPVLQPLPNLMIAVDGDQFEVDMVWPDLRVCVEIDGPIHDDPSVQREDRRRTRLLEAAGWTVLRIHWAAWEADRAGAAAPLVGQLLDRA